MELALIRKMDFRFSNLMHTAVVSMCSNREGKFVHIQLVNSFLCKLFGIEHIRFINEKGKIKLQAPANPFAWQVAELVNEKLNEDIEVTALDELHVVRS